MHGPYPYLVEVERLFPKDPLLKEVRNLAFDII